MCLPARRNPFVALIKQWLSLSPRFPAWPSRPPRLSSVPPSSWSPRPTLRLSPRSSTRVRRRSFPELPLGIKTIKIRCVAELCLSPACLFSAFSRRLLGPDEPRRVRPVLGRPGGLDWLPPPRRDQARPRCEYADPAARTLGCAALFITRTESTPLTRDCLLSAARSGRVRWLLHPGERHLLPVVAHRHHDLRRHLGGRQPAGPVGRAPDRGEGADPLLRRCAPRATPRSRTQFA